MSLKRILGLLIITLSVFLLDYFSKAWVNTFVSPIYLGGSVFPFGGIPIFHNFFGIDFCINYVFNYGAAWGLFSSMKTLLLMTRIGVILAIVGYIFFSPKSIKFHFPLSLIVGGAAGNVVDYFIYGYVVDMFHFIFWGHSFAVFNIADSAIFCGIVWIIVQSLGRKKTACLI